MFVLTVPDVFSMETLADRESNETTGVREWSIHRSSLLGRLRGF